MSRKSYIIRMELLSDAIFGSGNSVPGGADISNDRDSAGYPYFKGTSLKGLLRESAENLAQWGAVNPDFVVKCFGDPDRNDTGEELIFKSSPLVLTDRSGSAEHCYRLRTFTSLENGTVKTDTLRTAECIASGYVFEGEVSFDEADLSAMEDAVKGIKWVGTHRNRGFGRVSMSIREAKSSDAKKTVSKAYCLRYRLHNVQDLCITDLPSGSGNFYESRGFIPGSAIRGAVIGHLVRNAPSWFNDHRKEILSDGVRFLNALPVRGKLPVIPAIKGFYEDKAGSRLESVLKTGDITPGFKRAGVGEFGEISDNTVTGWYTEMSGLQRIDCGKKSDNMFQTRQIAAGQDFEGWILLKDEETAAEVSKAFAREIWVGADRTAGFGKCTVTLLEAAERPSVYETYGFGESAKPTSRELYLLLLSPMAMRNENGAYCGLDEAALAKKLGVASVSVKTCSTSMEEYTSYNRTWACREPRVRMYSAGSLFKLECSEVPALDSITGTQRAGLGIRKAEGFGQILFLRNDLYESITGKKILKNESPEAEDAHKIRRERLKWIMKKTEEVRRYKLSASQLGTVQAFCEKANIVGNTVDLDEFLRGALEERGAAKGDRFKEIAALIEKVKSDDLSGIGAGTILQKMVLLSQLFDHVRKFGGD